MVMSPIFMGNFVGGTLSNIVEVFKVGGVILLIHNFISHVEIFSDFDIFGR